MIDYKTERDSVKNDNEIYDKELALDTLRLVQQLEKFKERVSAEIQSKYNIDIENLETAISTLYTNIKTYSSSSSSSNSVSSSSSSSSSNSVSLSSSSSSLSIG